jgi:hypothetical protein
MKFIARLRFKTRIQVNAPEQPESTFEAREVFHSRLERALREVRWAKAGCAGWLFPQVRDSLTRADIFLFREQLQWRSR